MLKIDTHTSIHSRGKFARICVEIDLSYKLVPYFTVLDDEFSLEYEGLHSICFGCGKYGHKKENCPEIILANSEQVACKQHDPIHMIPEEQQEQTTVNHGDTTPVDGKPNCFGPWMMAKKASRRRPLKANNKSSDTQDPGSRFNILEVEQEQTDQTAAAQQIHSGNNQEAGKNKQQHGNSKKTSRNASKPKPTRQENKPSGGSHMKQNKENEPPATNMQIDKEDRRDATRTRTVEEEKAWLESLKQGQTNLGKQFQDETSPDKGPQRQPHAPSEEELRVIYALLQKKGITDAASLKNLMDTSDSDGHMVVEPSPPSL